MLHMSTDVAAGIVPEFTVGERLKKARQLTRLDQDEFARLVGVVRATVSNAERDIYPPKPILLNAWSLATGVPRLWLETGKVSRSEGPGEGVRHEGLEPPTRWFDISYSTCDYPGTLGELEQAS
jgi:transcriptional regulator with XRE-family HTH domain